jgi:TonB-dependent receptor
MFKPNALSLAIAASAAFSSAITIAQDDMTEEVTVTGIRSSLSKAIDIRRESDQIVDSVIAEDIGKFPDNNVVEAMKHITGVQVGPVERGEGVYVVVRGSDALVTTINGQEAFTSNDRSMSLADVPATLLSGVKVYKSSDASLIEGGVAGAVDIITHKPFDFSGAKVSFSAKGTYTDRSESTDPNLSGLVSNIWDTEAGKFGALLNVSYLKNNYREENIWGGGIFPYDRTTGVGTGEGDAGEPLSTAPDTSYALMRDASGAWDRYGETERSAFNLALQWEPAENMSFFLDAQQQNYENVGNMSFLFTRTDGAFSEGTGYSYYPGTNVVSEVSTVDAFVLTSSQAMTRETSSSQYTVGGKWEISDTFRVDASINTQSSNYDEALQILDLFSTAPTLDVKFNDGTGAVSLDYLDYSLNNDEGVTLGTYFDTWVENSGSANSAKVDAEWDFNAGIFDRVEFGFRLASHEAQGDGADPRVCCEGGEVNQAMFDGIKDYTPGDFYADGGQYPRQWLTPDIDWLLNADNQNTLRSVTGITNYYNESYSGRPVFDPTRHFDISENTTAGYGQVHYEFEIGHMQVDGLLGVRVVTTDSDLTGYEITVDPDSGDLTTELISLDSSNTEALPNASIKLELNDDMALRANYSKTLSRPDFADLNPATTLRPPIEGQINQGSGAGGNPNLEPFTSRNFDFAFEWYFGEDNALTATWFNRALENSIATTSVTLDVDDQEYVITRPENLGESNYNGLELGVTYFPDSLPESLNGLGVQASYTYIDGDRTNPETNEKEPLLNLSENSVSLALFYEKENFGVRLSHVYRDDYLLGYNYCCSMPTEIYVDALTQTDISASYDITDSVTMTFDITNLFNDEYHDYFGDAKLFNRDARIFSRTVALGVRASF